MSTKRLKNEHIILTKEIIEEYLITEEKFAVAAINTLKELETIYSLINPKPNNYFALKVIFSDSNIVEFYWPQNENSFFDFCTFLPVSVLCDPKEFEKEKNHRLELKKNKEELDKLTEKRNKERALKSIKDILERYPELIYEIPERPEDNDEE
jgi:hypothetical protein